MGRTALRRIRAARAAVGGWWQGLSRDVRAMWALTLVLALILLPANYRVFFADDEPGRPASTGQVAPADGVGPVASNATAARARPEAVAFPPAVDAAFSAAGTTSTSGALTVGAYVVPFRGPHAQMFLPGRDEQSAVQVGQGSDFKISGVLTNTGPAELTGARLFFVLPPELELISDPGKTRAESASYALRSREHTIYDLAVRVDARPSAVAVRICAEPDQAAAVCDDVHLDVTP